MDTLKTQNQVLVTGGTGFIASYCIIQLLQKGYAVKTTIRSLKRRDDVIEMLKVGGITAFDNLQFVEADLSKDDNWNEAVKDCDYVIHVASPTPLKDYKHEDEMIIPAREGVLRVLRAAKNALVKRVVLTSSFGAIGFGHDKLCRTPFTENDWTNVDSNTPTYQKSKALAEKAAWDFIAQEGGSLELATVNPVAVLGPVLSDDFSHSIVMIRQTLDGAVPFCPKIYSCYVDVRDVADLHIRAMENPKANGERFLAATESSFSMLDVAEVLKKHFGEKATKIPTKEVPNWLLRILALRNPATKTLIPMLGQYMDASGDKAKNLLDWKPRSNEQAIIDTAESLIRLGICKLK